MEHWQKPLRVTFAPWPDKVTIVPKYVGNKTEGNFVTIDDFMTGKPKDNLFLKMDIEGAERMALTGATNVLTQGENNQAAICTYHRIGDPEFINELFKRYGYTTELSEGLMYWNKRLSKGILRAKK
jgi:ABC-type microcin C transport system permease subunit YejB